MIEENVKHWLLEVVIGLQLCPFAKAPWQKGQIRFATSMENKEEALIHTLISECQLLNEDASIETTLLICPNALHDFFYCQFIEWANQTLKQHQWQGVNLHPKLTHYLQVKLAHPRKLALFVISALFEPIRIIFGLNNRTMMGDPIQ